MLSAVGRGLPAVGLAAWAGGLAAPARAQAAEGDLIWSQEFNDAAGTAPDPGVWNYDLGAGGWGNNELQTYTDSRDNSATDGNGNLAITARQDGGGYTSARLQTNDRFEIADGRIEASIKIPRGQGIWPAFWMLGGSFPGTGWPDCGEIDIMENIGKEPATVHGTVHGPGYSGAAGPTSSYQHPQGWSFADTWHTFTLDRGPETSPGTSTAHSPSTSTSRPSAPIAGSSTSPSSSSSTWRWAATGPAPPTAPRSSPSRCWSTTCGSTTTGAEAAAGAAGACDGPLAPAPQPCPT